MTRYVYSPSLPSYNDHTALVHITGYTGRTNPGDIFIKDNTWWLVLGNTLHTFEEYTYTTIQIPIDSIDTYYTHALDAKCMKHIHHLVYFWYSAYRDIIPFFLHHTWTDRYISTLASRKRTAPIAPECIPDRLRTSRNLGSDIVGQQCIVFATVRSMYHYSNSLKHVAGIQPLIISSKQTPKQRWEVFNAIRSGRTPLVCTTGIGIFAPWHSLQHITLIDSHTRHYKRQKHPRIDLRIAIQYMCSLYDASYTFYTIQGESNEHTIHYL